MRSRRSIIAIVICAGMLVPMGFLARCYVRAGPPNKGVSMQAERPASKQPDLEASEQTGTAGPDIRASSWKVLAGCHLSSVAWSPGGDYIAFVATPKASSEEYREEIPEYAGIWLLEAPVKGVRLKRLIRFDTESIAVALFWMSDTEIGWATNGYHCADYVGFTFLAVDLKGGKPRQLVPCGFKTGRTWPFVPSQQPNDVYWNAEGREILFTSYPVFGPPGPAAGLASPELLAIYRLDGGTLEMVGLHDVDTPVSFCGVPGTEGVYLATVALPLTDPEESVLWHAGSYRSVEKREKIAGEVGRRIVFPRLSPGGEKLAWLSVLMRDEYRPVTDKLVVYDLAGRVRRVVASLSSYWDVPDPGLGCPYSWSPTGEEIAYADGSVVKTVHVPADAAGRN